MIVKFFELKKKNLKGIQFFLLYGNNKGLIEETYHEVIKPAKKGSTFTYDEDEIIKNTQNFEETILNKSFFDNEKLIIINRTSDKMLRIIEKCSDPRSRIINKVNELRKKHKLTSV